MINTTNNIQMTKEFGIISIWIMLSFSFFFVISMSSLRYGQVISLIALCGPAAFHGLFQMQTVSRYIRPMLWLIITIVSSAIGWGIIYIVQSKIHSEVLFTISDKIPFAILQGISLGTAAGCIIGCMVGCIQWFFARPHLNLFRWLFPTVMAWCIGLAVPLALLFWFLAGMSGLGHIEL